MTSSSGIPTFENESSWALNIYMVKPMSIRRYVQVSVIGQCQSWFNLSGYGHSSPYTLVWISQNLLIIYHYCHLTAKLPFLIISISTYSPSTIFLFYSHTHGHPHTQTHTLPLAHAISPYHDGWFSHFQFLLFKNGPRRVRRSPKREDMSMLSLSMKRAV